MPKVLIVEDNQLWQGILREELESLVDKGDIIVAGNYHDAISNSAPDVSLYILDGRFPNNAGEKPQLLGLQLAIDLHNRGVDYQRISLTSASSAFLQAAKNLGIEKVYHKGTPDEKAGERGIERLVDDLRPLLTS